MANNFSLSCVNSCRDLVGGGALVGVGAGFVELGLYRGDFCRGGFCREDIVGWRILSRGTFLGFPKILPVTTHFIFNNNISDNITFCLVLLTNLVQSGAYHPGGGQGGHVPPPGQKKCEEKL